MHVRRLGWIALPFTAALALAGCQTNDPQLPFAANAGVGGGGASGNIVSIALPEPTALIPSNVQDVYGAQVAVALWTPLVVFNNDGKPVPEQAQSITTKDSKVWTIKLKPGYTFSNGEQVTSDSYIRAWNYATYGPNGQANSYYFAHIAGYDKVSDPKSPSAKTLSGLTKIDQLTFRVTLDAPYADFETELGFTAFEPLPQAAFTASGALDKTYGESPIGDGPFKMKGAWNHNQSIEVERYAGYPGPKPHVDGVVFKIYGDPHTAYQDALANDLDVLPNLATPDLATAPGDFGKRFQHSPQSGFQYLAFPLYDPNYAKLDVRRAISMAIDRDAIVKLVYANQAIVAHSFVSPVLPGFRDDTCGKYCQYNPSAARALYNQAGGPKKITIEYNGDGPHREWITAVCHMLANNLNVACNPSPVPTIQDYIKSLAAKATAAKLGNVSSPGMFRLGWAMDYPSMEDYLTPLYGTSGSNNYYGFHDAQFDKLVKEGTEQPTAASAIAMYQQAENIVAANLPVLPMWFQQNNYVFSARVHNVSVDLFGLVDLINLTTSSG